MQNIEIATKQDIATLEQETTAITAKANFKITSQETLKEANEIMKFLNTKKKLIAEKKSSIITPIKTAVKNTNELFKPMEENISDAVQYLKAEVLTYKEKVDKAIRKQQLEIIKKKTEGELTTKEAYDKVMEVEEKTSEFKTRTYKEIEITDLKKIPQEYYKLDMVLLRKDALSGKEIAGVKVVTKERATM